MKVLVELTEADTPDKIRKHADELMAALAKEFGDAPLVRSYAITALQNLCAIGMYRATTQFDQEQAAFHVPEHCRDIHMKQWYELHQWLADLESDNDEAGTELYDEPPY